MSTDPYPDAWGEAEKQARRTGPADYNEPFQDDLPDGPLPVQPASERAEEPWWDDSRPEGE